MIINTCYKIYNNNCTIKKRAEQSKPLSDISAENTELPNIFYRPFFTAKKDVNKDFEVRYKKLKEKFTETSLPENIVTKENIDFAEKLYKDGILNNRISSEAYCRLVSLVNKDNKNFANKTVFVCLGQRLFYQVVASILPYVNKDNEDIADKLWGFTSPILADEIMSSLTKENIPLVRGIFKSENVDCKDYAAERVLQALEEDDGGIRALAELCLNCYDNYEEEPTGFPKKLIPLFPKKIEPKTVDLFQQIYKKDYLTAHTIYHSMTAQNIDMVECLLKNLDKIDAIHMEYVLKSTDKNNQKFLLKVFDNNEYNGKQMAWLSSFTHKLPEAIPIIEREIENGNFDVDKVDKFFQYIYFADPKIKIFMLDCGIDNIERKLNYQKQLILKYPEKYINHDRRISEIDDFSFYYNHRLTSVLLDKETLDVLFRKRLNKADNFSRNIHRKLNYSDLLMLKKAMTCKTTAGRPLTPQQKIDLVDVICDYRSMDLNTDCLDEMVKNNKIDITELKVNIFKHVISMIDPDILNKTPDFSNEKLLKWNIEYIHLLNNSYMNKNEAGKTLIRDIIKMANSEKDFKRLIHSKNCRFYDCNNINKQEFKKFGLDYNKWLNPPKDAEVNFVSANINTKQLKQTADQLTEDIEILRQSGAKNFIDKQLKHCIKNDKFVIPKEYYSCKSNLQKFILGLNKQLARVWVQAERNLDNPDKSYDARQTMMIKDHINQKYIDICDLQDNEPAKELNITIKMWDRIPQKDLFQGNYSNCCIGMGSSNEMAKIEYLMNTTFNMIELVDNKTGNTIGNALCYFINTKNGPEFVIDNVEIRYSVRPDSEVGKNLRESIKEYALNITKSVAGKELPIYMGERYNDIPDDDLPIIEKTCMVLGTFTNDVYMDAFGGWYPPYNEMETIDIYKL